MLGRFAKLLRMYVFLQRVEGGYRELNAFPGANGADQLAKETGRSVAAEILQVRAKQGW